MLGALPGIDQPSQKQFETRLLATMRRLDPARPTFVEAESRKIGLVQVPEPLIDHMRAAPCIAIEATREARIAFLLRDYAYLGDDVEALKDKIGAMKAVQSNETLAQWKALADVHDLKRLFGEFIDRHYDPLYQRSQNRNFAGFTNAPRYVTDDLSPPALDALARQILLQTT